jgi:hypothetical protein
MRSQNRLHLESSKPRPAPAREWLWHGLPVIIISTGPKCRKSASVMSVTSRGRREKTSTNGSRVKLLWIQQHQLMKMLSSYTGGYLRVFHIDIPFNREARFQHGRQSCANAPKYFHQNNLSVWRMPHNGVRQRWTIR